MKQPNLGEKIAELRKAKGYTQEELVEKCNLNVRTLQRIEAGDVTPRSYTIKLIFEALDHDVYESTKSTSSKFKRTRNNISNKLEILQKRIIDETSFKKHPINKVSFFIILALSILLILSLINTPNNSKNSASIRNQIENKNREFTHWFDAGEIDSLGTLYLDSASVIFAEAVRPLISVTMSVCNPAFAERLSPSDSPSQL